MNIESTNKDIPHSGVHRDSPAGARWQDVKRWSRAKPRLSRVVWIALALCLVALVIWAIYPRPQARQGRFNNGPQPVGVATAVSGPINVTLNALGTVTPLATATVRPQVSGLLTKLNFTEGQLVKAGDLLAQIDPRPYQAALDQAKGQLARDQANLTNAKVDLARYKTLQAQGASYGQQVDTQGALVQSDAGIVTSDQANVETAQINLGYTRIVSPISGRVGLHQVDVGNLVSAGQSNGLVVVTELSPISVLFTVPEDNVSQIMGRVASGAELAATAYDRSQTIKIADGKLATVDNEVDTTTGTVKLRAMFDNQDGKLFPSQFVNIHLLVDTLQNQTVVPVAAIQRGADGAFVFVVGADKTVSQRDVKLGIQDGDKVAIVSGLKPGETVVVDGADRLRDGAQVSIPNPGKQSLSQAPPANNDSQRAARQAQLQQMEKICAADIKKFCAQTQGPPMRCLNQNRSSVSSDCAQAMGKLRRGRPGGGGGLGGAP